MDSPPASSYHVVAMAIFQQEHGIGHQPYTDAIVRLAESAAVVIFPAPTFGVSGVGPA